jgi:hypothetical protein
MGRRSRGTLSDVPIKRIHRGGRLEDESFDQDPCAGESAAVATESPAVHDDRTAAVVVNEPAVNADESGRTVSVLDERERVRIANQSVDQGLDRHRLNEAAWIEGGGAMTQDVHLPAAAVAIDQSRRRRPLPLWISAMPFDLTRA